MGGGGGESKGLKVGETWRGDTLFMLHARGSIAMLVRLVGWVVCNALPIWRLTMAKKKQKNPDMAVFDDFDRLSLNENTKNQWPFERYSKVLQI